MDMKNAQEGDADDVDVPDHQQWTVDSVNESI
jgi:hypothetical protein